LRDTTNYFKLVHYALYLWLTTYPQTKEAPMLANHRGFYLSLASTNSLNRIRHLCETRLFRRLCAVDERGGVMNVSEWFDLFLAVCRLIFHLLEFRKARRRNSGPQDTS
jgi:hypothetical protein